MPRVDGLIQPDCPATLDPDTHDCQLNYRIGINLGDKVAPPRDSI